MSNQQHTQEPWSDDGFGRICATGSDQFNGGFFVAICEGPDKQENARRIVACVKACARIETSLLEQFPGGINGLSNVAIAKQRDELLAALEALYLDTFESAYTTASVAEAARVAIAKAKGGAA